MKIAIVHDFLLQMGGAEKVLDVLHDMFPEAPVFTSAYDPRAMPSYYRDWDIRTTFLQSLWWKRDTHRLAIMFYPYAFERFDLNGFDLVISSSSAFAKGVVTDPNTMHICYTHAPMRYAWTTQTYLKNERLGPLSGALFPPIAHYLRLWDSSAAARVDHYIANSSAVARRIEKYYRRPSQVVFPPVDTARFQISDKIEDYYIIVARCVPYKRLDLAVEAFTRMKRPLKVVGAGRYLRALRAKAGSTIQFLGHVNDTDLPGLLAHAKAFVMPGEEDFGIAPVEANACGRPVLAYAAGGALDTQVDNVTGVLFDDQTVDGLCEAICQSDHIDFDPVCIRNHALRFDTAVFRREIKRAISEFEPTLIHWSATRRPPIRPNRPAK